MWQIQFGRLILAGMVAGVLSASVFLASLSGSPTSMTITPWQGTSKIGGSFMVSLQVTSVIPVNVFKGIVRYDTSRLQIEKIDYNTSIADLWAEEPWYSNGDGTLSFIGGTTKQGGFQGEGQLITIAFKSIAPGEASITLNDVRILQHDGLGSETDVAKPIDALFTVEPEKLQNETVATEVSGDKGIVVLPENKTTDLNGDGMQSIIDISIFMRHLSSQNTRSDFNGDGIVTTKDLSIILNN